MYRFCQMTSLKYRTRRVFRHELDVIKSELLMVDPPSKGHLFETHTSYLKTVTFPITPPSKTSVSLLIPSLHLTNILKILLELPSIISATFQKCDTNSDADTLVHAFVSSRLDYCNVQFSGLPKSSVRSLQLVQKAADRILTKTRTSDHMTPDLSSLHWLLIQVRDVYKVLLLTQKILHGEAPSYLSDLITPHLPAIALRSCGHVDR